MTSTDVAFHSWPTAKLTAEWWSYVAIEMWKGQNACSDRSPGAQYTANTGCTAGNGVEPCTSTTVTIGTFPMPTLHVASLLVSSYVSAQLPTRRATGEIGLHQLHWPFYVTEPMPLHTKTNPVEQQFPLAIERVQSQTELLRWLCLKRVGTLPRHDEADE